jgi:hypothetical protein
MGTILFDFIRKLWSSNGLTDKPKPRSFDEYVLCGILASNEFGISEVIGLRSIKSMYFERDKYLAIASLIKEQNLAQLMAMPEGDRHPTFPEYLAIMQFENQSGLNFIVTEYDSIELWQNPQVIDIFPFS